ncbi:Crossover junction endonuclease MUS81 [Pseudolycoriella hygida]|uniref:Multifunctional fusion protein n=1 Tax=Pseudolycoriella hygida TaxID=35572 RepID=A0A9Q0MQK3_9DIPT|nr:Crossover junction endonuclease MUS81 [Pseudolycoriella hygida]
MQLLLFALSTIAFQVVIAEGVQFVFFIGPTVVILCQLFLYCYYGQRITDQACSLSDSVYQLKWYNYPTKFQKYFQLIMLRSQNSFFFSGMEKKKCCQKSCCITIKSEVKTILLSTKLFLFNTVYLAMADKDKAKVDLGLLEEDDEFEEFPAEDWTGTKENEDELNVWEDNWDDDNVEDDFSQQLRAQLEGQKSEKNPCELKRNEYSSARFGSAISVFMKFKMFSTSPNKQRIKLTQINPNPLFEKWLVDWIKQAESKNSMKKHALMKALDSLRKYPLVLRTGRDCAILDGFGEGICRMLDEKLQRENHVVSEQKLDESLKEAVKIASRRINQDKRRQIKETVVGPSTVANAIREDFQMPGDSEPCSSECSDTVFMTGGSFTIILLVDTAETVGKAKRNLDATIQQLTERKVKFEVRRLSVGDFLWICRDSNNQEVVLPYIVERKRMDDLAASIKDKRFHEQKFRLRGSGVQNIIYLIESKGNNQFLGLPISNLLQAGTNTQIQNGFSVKFTDSHTDSMLYLTVLTNILIATYKDKNLMITNKENLWPCGPSEATIPVMKFSEFTQLSTKMRNFTIKDLFVRQLVQLKTLNVEKALAITKVYPTPSHLLMRYNQCIEESEGELLLAEIQYSSGKKIGPTISRAIYHLYNSKPSEL